MNLLNQIISEVPAILISFFIVYLYNMSKKMNTQKRQIYSTYSSFVKFLIIILFINY